MESIFATVDSSPNYNKVAPNIDVKELKYVTGSEIGLNNAEKLNYTDEECEILSKRIQLVLGASDETVEIKTSNTYEYGKRLFDIVASLFAIVVLSPFLILVSLLIFFNDFHAPIFKQIRLTKLGKPFYMYKFRTMIKNADSDEMLKKMHSENVSDTKLSFKLNDDPRITKIGKFLRKTSLDELMQLFNVLKGDMSVIGPRPPLPREVVHYTARNMNRVQVKSGLSCYWQSEGGRSEDVDGWFESDIKYIQERSFLVDAKIILKTIQRVLKSNNV